MPIILPASLDTLAAGTLRTNLKNTIDRGESVLLNGGDVEQVWQACLQVLVSAQQAAKEAKLVFRIEDPSDALTGMAQLAGLDLLLQPA